MVAVTTGAPTADRPADQVLERVRADFPDVDDDAPETTDAGPRTAPSSLADAASVALTVGIGAVVGYAWDSTAGAVIAGLSALVALLVGVTVHEGGHAVTAHAVGLVVETVTLGTGPQVATFTVGPARIRVRAFPFSGLVTYARRSAPGGGAARSLSSRPARS